jgi:two-component system, NtrC family, response regulator AtoC
MRILIVDDEKNLRESIAEYLKIEGMETEKAENALAAKRLLGESVFDAAVVDLKMPGMSGLELLSWMREQGPEVPVIMISAYGDIDDAVSAMKIGAKDYLVKPFNPEELAIRISRMVSARRLSDAASALKIGDDAGERLVGQSRAIAEIRRLVDKIAPTDATILITGESGTGKEVTARSIHDKSSRSEEPFVAINVGSIPETLLESELFGFERGAFTGADARKSGIFELANKGTLFLDEIGDMPQHLQVKLLRAIQEKKIRRIGAAKDLPTDIRIIAATNRDIEAAVHTGAFREDLYYRINVIRIRLPPLRERMEDIQELADAFIRRLSARLGRKIDGLSRGALERLQVYRFPGNVRELENILERAVILCESQVIGEGDLLLPIVTNGKHTRTDAAPSAVLPTLNLGDLEKAAVSQALLRWEGRREKAARELGISRRTLLNKIKDFGLA